MNRKMKMKTDEIYSFFCFFSKANTKRITIEIIGKFTGKSFVHTFQSQVCKHNAKSFNCAVRRESMHTLASDSQPFTWLLNFLSGD